MYQLTTWLVGKHENLKEREKILTLFCKESSFYPYKTNSALLSLQVHRFTLKFLPVPLAQLCICHLCSPLETFLSQLRVVGQACTLPRCSAAPLFLKQVLKSKEILWIHLDLQRWWMPLSSTLSFLSDHLLTFLFSHVIISHYARRDSFRGYTSFFTLSKSHN